METCFYRKGLLGLSNKFGQLYINLHQHTHGNQSVTAVPVKLMGFTPKLVLKEIYSKGQNQWWQFCPSYLVIRSFDVFPGAPLQAS